MRWLSVGVMALAVAACSSSPNVQEKPLPTPEPIQVRPASARHAATGEFGLDLAAGRHDVRPGDDFFAYANGRWYDSVQIPPDRASFGILNTLDERSKQEVRELIERTSAAHPAAGTPEQKLGDYYASFLDEQGIEARGLVPAQPDLARIQAASSKRDIAALFGARGFAALVDIDLIPDFKNPDRYSIVISQGRLGLPERDYYLKDDPKLKELREKYLGYIMQILTLGGVADSGAQAQAVMALETAAARAQWSQEQRRAVDRTYNPMGLQELKGYAPGLPWDAFLDAAELSGRTHLIVAENTAIRGLAALFDRTGLTTLKSFLIFHYLSDHAAYLPRRFDEARFDFYGRTLRGQPQQRERWKRAVDEVNAALGELAGQLYVKEYFPPASKTKMLELVGNLRAALGLRIDAIEWMTPETKARAHEKLAAFLPKIGYPDRWKDYSALSVRRDDIMGNVQRATEWDWRYQVARLDKPVDRAEWRMTPQTVNAYYNPLHNEIVFPAAILQPPFFDPGADAAVNYGAIGAVIGHEMGHGFDDQGRKFGPDGGLKDWWTRQDEQVFSGRVHKLIEQYSRFQALPGLNVNGAKTIGENIGDLGGLNIAYAAYKLSLKGQPAPDIGGLTGDQRFFLSWAQVQRAKYREGALRELVMSDPHCPPYFRVNGPLPNIDAWYQAFGVQPGDKLYIKPEDRVSIW
jgi:predicted metalloendopeptidase